MKRMTDARKKMLRYLAIPENRELKNGIYGLAKKPEWNQTSPQNLRGLVLRMERDELVKIDRIEHAGSVLKVVRITPLIESK